jgi:hypothetical protein
MSNQYRKVYVIAGDIVRDWKNVNYAAKPYLDAMFSLDSIEDPFILDTGKSVVLYFLCNAGAWRGPVAKRIKGELKAMTQGKAVPFACLPSL